LKESHGLRHKKNRRETFALWEASPPPRCAGLISAECVHGRLCAEKKKRTRTNCELSDQLIGGIQNLYHGGAQTKLPGKRASGRSTKLGTNRHIMRLEKQGIVTMEQSAKPALTPLV
jgi:hypothetical protein